MTLSATLGGLDSFPKRSSRGLRPWSARLAPARLEILESRVLCSTTNAAAAGMFAGAAVPRPAGASASFASATADPVTNPFFIDPALGSDGATELPLTGPDGTPPVGVFQPDGKLLVVGSYGQIKIARLNTDGSVDTTFGSGGAATVGSGSGFISVLVQADGKIVIASGSLYRLNADGTPDPTFQGAYVDFFTSALAQASNGDILVAGSDPTGRARLMAFNPDGSADASFGVSAQVSLPATLTYDRVSQLLVGVDGKITMGGNLRYDFNGPRPVIGGGFVTRFNSDGSPDANFNGGSVVSLSIPGQWPQLTDLQILPDGKLLLVGMGGATLAAGTGEQDVKMARLNSDGSRDITFGADGAVVDDPGANSEVGITMRATITGTGEIVLRGYGNKSAYRGRFTADGTLLQSEHAPTPFNVFVSDFALIGPDGSLQAIGSRAFTNPGGELLTRGVVTRFEEALPSEGPPFISSPTPIDPVAGTAGPQQGGPLQDSNAIDTPSSTSYRALIALDRATLFKARQQRAVQLRRTRSALRTDAAAYRAFRHRVKAMTVAGTVTIAAVSTNAPTTELMSAQLAQAQASLAAERSAIVSFSRSDLSGVFAAKRQLAADIQGLRHAQRAGN